MSRPSPTIRLLFCAVSFQIGLAASVAYGQTTRPVGPSAGTVTPLTLPFQVPPKPTAPPSLVRKPPADIFRCERPFIYKGQTLSCDSGSARDAENLRPIIREVPAAVAQLDEYQRTRKNIAKTAYIGSAGLLVAALSSVTTALFFRMENGQISDEGQRLGRLMIVGGLGLTGGSLAYGLTTLQTNEKRIDLAVQKYNQARPETPIELKFSTGF